ncbi:MAG: PSD1 and planctomycete cytochrome C domain-containing protein [Fuerstiella sp.]
MLCHQLPKRSFAIIFLSLIVCGTNLADESTIAKNTTTQGTASNDDDATLKAQEEFFHAKVLPLLQARCFECHDRAKDQAPTKELGGGLLLSSRKAMLVGGDTGPAIVPGDPNDSLLIQAVRYDGYEMPPRSKMPTAEIQILERWITEGAYFPKNLDSAPEFKVSEFPLDQRAEDHWAWHFQPESIAVPTSTDNWSTTNIDRFVHKSLAEQGLSPAADADRATLIRRLSFDITGLPPTIAEINAFTQDPRPVQEAIEDVANRLLSSSAFGEHWGRHWLDLVRYADTLGHEFDYPLHDAWKYRDYVIRAINEDVPYDQFVKEHLAGDVLANPRTNPKQRYNESIIGTGFWFLHENKHGPVDVRAEEAAIIDNQIDVFSKTFLGMTLACARCHDHKFDAISTADYYAMAGYLQSSRRQAAWLDPDQKIKQQLSELAKIKSQAIRQLDQIATVKATTNLTATYLAAAVQALNSSASSPVQLIQEDRQVKHTKNADVVFTNFEEASFDDLESGGWTATGDAFSKGSIAGAGGPSQQLKGLQGQRSANTFLGTDHVTGTLTSPSFEIKNPAISFLVAGGTLAENVGIHLLIDGEIIMSAAGTRGDSLQRRTWLVEDFIGKTAQLQISDQSKGGWGHIVVDDIRFDHSAADLPLVRNLEQLAMHFHLDQKLLRKWVRQLHAADFKNAPNLLRPAITFAQSCVKHSLDVSIKKLNEAKLQDSTWEQQLTELATVVADFSDGLPSGWRTSGQSFSPESSAPGTLWRRGNPIFEDGCLSSASLSVNQRGSLFSPTFTLDGDQVLVHIAGKTAGLRLVIDGYIMHEFTPLLFSGTKVDVNTDGEFRWVALAGDTSRYQGHKAHLEIRDDNNGWFAIRQIVMPKPGKANAVKQLLKKQPNFSTASTKARSPFLNTSEQNLVSVIESLIPKSNFAPRIQQSWLKEKRLLSTEDDLQVAQAFASWKQQASKLPAPLKVMAMMDGSPENERIFIRGNHKSLGDEVPRHILTALRRNAATSQDRKEIGSKDDFMAGSGRLQLAMQVVDRKNPLTSRVAVNRIWHHLFGRGLVSTTDNFGVMGTEPSHPELLDYLAVKFMDEDWSTKSMIKQMVRSRTYRQRSQSSDKTEQADPTNRYLHRANIRRLPAEAIRDSMLSVAGELKNQQFGSPVPIHLSAFMQGRGRPGTNGPLDGQGRRSIYLKINRNFLSPMMTAFDSPTPFTTIGRRNISNVPAQALILLNNEFVTEMSKRWAAKLMAEQTTTTQKLTKAWQQLYGFEPTAAELSSLLQYASNQTVAAENETEVITDLLHVLFNGKQFLYLR